MTRLLAFGGLVALLQAPPAGQTPLLPGDGLIAGRVIDGVTSRPVTGVVVTLISRPSPGAPAVPNPAQALAGGVAGQPSPVLVDASGRFIFAGLRAGTYEISATKRGSVPGAFGKLRPDGTSVAFALADHERRIDLTARVWKHASIAGVVIDEMNEPVVGVSVLLLRREFVGGELRFNTVASSATTDDRGAYRLGLLLAGDYVVAVPSAIITLPLDALDGNSPPEPSARAAVVQMAAAIGGQTPGTRDAQRVGDVVMQNSPRAAVPPQPSADGRVTVYPSAYSPETPGAPATASVVTLAAGESKSISPIRLRPVTAVRVTGTLAGISGAVPATTLILTPQHADGFASELGFQTAKTTTDAKGAFTFLGVTPGTYRLRASTTSSPPPPPGLAAPGYVPTTKPMYWLNDTITVGSTDLALSLSMRPTLSVTGRFVFAGERAQPPPERIVRDVVSVAAADGRQMSSSPGRDMGTPPGGFTIAELSGGRYVLRPYVTPNGWYLKSITRGGADTLDVPFDLTEDVSDVVFTFTDRPSVIRGAVRTSTGAADTEALVIVFPASPQRWTDVGRMPIGMRTTRASAAGAYTLTGLPPGDYLIAAVTDVSASTWQTPTYLEALGRSAKRIRVEEGATIAQDLARTEIVR